MHALIRELWPGCVGSAMLLWARVSLAPHTPSFTPADNPAAHAPSLLTRTLSIARGWAVHGRLLVWPATLSFDWSMGAVPLVTSLGDAANLETAALLAVVAAGGASAAAACWRARSRVAYFTKLYTYHSHHAYHDVLNNNVQHGDVDGALPAPTAPCCAASHSAAWWHSNPLLLVLAWALLVVPFLPASNLAAYVGFVVAERVLYLPSMGACLLVALGCQSLWHRLGSCKSHRTGEDREKLDLSPPLKFPCLTANNVLIIKLISSPNTTPPLPPPDPPPSSPISNNTNITNRNLLSAQHRHPSHRTPSPNARFPPDRAT